MSPGPSENKDLRDLILAHLDGRLEDGDFGELESRLLTCGEARRLYVNLASLDAGMADLGPAIESGDTATPPTKRGFRPVASLVLLTSVTVALILATPIWLMRPAASRGEERIGFGPGARGEAQGIAVITAQAGAVWGASEARPPYREGMSLAPGELVLQQGLAQIDFFGGASVSLSGPARIELVSRDRAILHQGRLRADVPPAARGFEILTGDVVLEDLGTSFGLAVDGDQADLVVFDGEVRATGRDGNSLLLLGGDAAHLARGQAVPHPEGFAGAFPDINEIFAGAGSRDEARYSAWLEASEQLRRDPRLVAYYDFENLTPMSRRLRNRAVHGRGAELDGGIVGARTAEGRWAGKTALDFRRDGDRVRFRIPGEFTGLTLFAWVRIDALDRHLNSLFLTDHYDEGEFHWQISDKGALHFSSSPEGPRDLLEHNRRFYSDLFWTPAQSGQWFLLATTVAPGKEGVTHYINGKAVGFSGGLNREKPLSSFRIGPADLGNWSEPIWPTAIRTLNGRIDEFGIFGEPLAPEEIRNLHELGKP